MRVLVIMGSRNREGQTAQAAAALLRGMESHGWESETVFLPEMSIDHCHQCNERGWGGCRMMGCCRGADDDFGPLVERIRAADLVVFGNPVYFADLSESLWAFLRRLRRICTHEDGKQGIVGKRAVGICLAGGSGGGAPETLVVLEKTLAGSGFDVVDLIPVRRQNFEHKLQVLHLTGEWLAAQSG
ncbi:MAG: flavodoxin family protein [Chloroflexi bacterium]|nr:flavodoxin family protein [Chloroflexota bacterium]